MAEVHGVISRSDGPLAWTHAEERLERARNYWLATSRPDGTPHAAPVWGVWVEGALYFGTGRDSMKGKNLSHNPKLVVHLESGDDVVILEGEVEEVADRASFEAIDAAYRAKYGMGVTEAGEDGAVWYVVRPRKAYAWLESDFPNTSTRWWFHASRDAGVKARVTSSRPLISRKANAKVCPQQDHVATHANARISAAFLR